MSNHTSWLITHLKKKIFLKIFFLKFSKNFFRQISPNYVQKRWFKKVKKIFFWKKIFCGHDFFSKIATKSRKIDKSNKCQRFQIGNTLRFSEHIDFFEFGLVQHRKLTKNPKKNFQKKIFFFQMCNMSTCVVWHKLKLYETKPPHLRNTWIAFLWPKCLYYCHTRQSKYKS